ncbi:hypothetical protein N7539_002859 [Penicillium diatomitis]|uniref:Uncharacterized protein n=1 Tax=Penicillium diatomitis TaxID=2819901 RepID=A0A9X0BZL0_9EURO|nr:uncharacterized protein N7539_002859 [Penicillium diatomitis]KAJ5491292.1 hypothetical protein N7539_002859 [Penicillium diatomitis]
MFHYGPALCGQIRESSSWSQGMNCDGFNVWRPSSLLFGICITTLGPNPIKLNSNDLVVTDALKDTDIQKTMGLDTIRFSHANIVGAVDIDRPPFYRCSVCFSSRGGDILASGERWKFTEIDSDYYHFFHEEEHPRQDASSLGANSLVWMFYSCSPDSIYMEGIPEDLPFRLDLDTRVCRVKGPSSCPNYGLTGGAVLAVMNRDGIVYCDGVDQNRDLNTVDLKNLVLMTALAVAHYEKWAIA